MALTYVTAGTTPSGSTGAGQGTSSVVPDIPSASTNVGDLLILMVGTKPDTATIVTPTDWLPVPGAGNLAGGGGTTGTDAGPTRCAMFYRISNGDETDVTVTITNGTSSWGQVFVFRESAAGSKFLLNATSGEDATTGSAWSVTGSSNPGFTTDDHVLVGSSIPTDVTTPNQFSSESISATGATFAAMTELSEPDVTQGGDVAGFVARTTVTAGTSTAAPVYTATAATTNTNVRGVSIILRIRSAPTVIQRFGSQTTVSTTAQTTAAVDLVTSTPVGALQIVAMSLNTAGTGVDTPTGWRRITPVAQIIGSYEHVVMARFRQTGDAASVTFTLNATSDWAAVATAYTGVYYQDLSDGSLSNTIPFQSWANTEDAGNDALLNTGGSVQNEYEDGWAVAAFGERIASPSATSFEIRSTFPIQFQFTEVADIASSGTTKSGIAWYDSNGGGIPISNFTNMFAAATFGTASTEKTNWWGTLRPAQGIAFDQDASSVSTANESTAVVSLPVGTDPGKLLIMNLVTGVATTPTTPSGWTQVASTTDGACSHHVYWRASSGAEGSTVSVSLGASSNWAAITRSFVGADTADPFIDTQVDTETATDTTLTTTAISNTEAFGWSISAFGARSTTNGATWTVTTTGGNIREHADVSSSISSSNYANLVATHSNTPVPVTDITFTGTGASSAEKVAWSAILRPAPTAREVPAGHVAISATANNATVLTSDVSFVGEEHFGGTTINQTTATVNKPAGTAEGDLMLATIHTNDQTLTATGWTLVDNTLSGAMRSHLYYRIAGASEASSYDFSVGTATIIGAAISVWRNVDETTPLDFEVSSATSGDPVTGPTLVTSVAAKILHTRQAREASASNPTYTADKGTERFDFGSANTVSYSQALYEESGHTASGSITGASIDCSGSPTNTVSRTIALFPAGGSATSADAGAASATGTANSSAISLSSNSGTATPSGTAHEPDARIGGLAPLVTASVDAEDSSASISASGGSASVAASAENAVGLPGIQALAGEVSVAATAAGSTVAESVAAEHVSVVGTANAPTLDLDASAPAGTADGTVAANASIGSISLLSDPSSTNITAENSSTALTATAGTATSSTTAFDATASTTTDATADAGHADVAGVASSGIGGVGGLAGESVVSSTANAVTTDLDANAGSPSGTAVVENALIANTSFAQSVSVSVAANGPTVSTVAEANAPAGHVAITTATEGPGTAIQVPAGDSVVTVVAPSPLANAGPLAGWALVSIVPLNQAEAQAGESSVAVTVNGASVSTTPIAEPVSLAVLANGPLSGVGASAGHAVVTASASDSLSGVSSAAGHASGTSVANNASSAMTATAGHAATLVSTENATANTSSSTNAQAGEVSVAGAASSASVASNAFAQAGSVDAVANNVTASTVAATDANAGHASISGAAEGISSAVEANAGTSAIAVTANNATVATVPFVNAPAGEVAASAVANGAAVSTSCNAQSVAVPVAAENATASTVASESAPAGDAAASVAANNATVVIVTNAQLATVTVAGRDALAGITFPAESVVTVGTVEDLAPRTGPIAGDPTSVTVSAYNATILVAGLLVALAPTPSASLTEGLKGGPLAATFPMPEVFLRSTPEGRIILIPARVERRVIRAEDRVGAIPPEDRQTEEE